MNTKILPSLIAVLCIGCAGPTKPIVANLPDALLLSKLVTNAQQKLTGLDEFLLALDSARQAFPYWEHVGMVGKGSGVYLGDGWVITSAHVGCFPFLMSDGSHYNPKYFTWKVLKGADGSKSDLAVFQVLIPDKSSRLAGLGNLPVGVFGENHAKGVVMIGTGYIQTNHSLKFDNNGKALAVLGYRVQPLRRKSWGSTSLTRILAKSLKTGQNRYTECFSTTFDTTAFSAQAADGDSGGGLFAYNNQLQRWELVGCIIAVTQRSNLVVFGNHTYMGNLGLYLEQIPGVDSGAISLINLTSEQGNADMLSASPASTTAPTP